VVFPAGSGYKPIIMIVIIGIKRCASTNIGKIYIKKFEMDYVAPTLGVCPRGNGDFVSHSKSNNRKNDCFTAHAERIKDTKTLNKVICRSIHNIFCVFYECHHDVFDNIFDFVTFLIVFDEF